MCSGPSSTSRRRMALATSCPGRHSGSDPPDTRPSCSSIYSRADPCGFCTLLLAFVLLLTGCVFHRGTASAPERPRFCPGEAEVGDRLEVIGAGFPEGKSAHVLFKGTLYRPGHKAIKGVEIDVQSASSSADKIEMMFTEGLQTSFCGSGDDAMHTTFKGDVIVSFPASTPGALPITGSARDVQIDFRSPSSRRAVVQARQDEGDRALKFMGLTVSDESPASGGLRAPRFARRAPPIAPAFWRAISSPVSKAFASSPRPTSTPTAARASPP